MKRTFIKTSSEINEKAMYENKSCMTDEVEKVKYE